MRKCPLCSSAEREEWLSLPGPRRYWLCKECRLVWLDEAHRLSRAAEEARYRTHQNVITNNNYIAYLSGTALPVAKLLPPAARGLDYGCGPTEGMKALLSTRGFSVDSYDPIFFNQPELLKNHYDFVLCCEAAEHFFEPAREFARISAMLKPGGILGVSSRLAVAREDFAAWAYRRDPTHVAFYQPETVRWIGTKFHWQLLTLENPLWIFRCSPRAGGT